MPILEKNSLPNPLGERKPKRKRKKLPTDKFYNSSKWRKLSKAYLLKNPLCVICEDLGDHVDHIEPWQLGGAKYSRKNLQTLCKPCHGRKTLKETREKNK